MATALEPGPLAAGRRIEVRGTVQGVGFRPWVYRLAREEGIRGRVRNDGAGVTIEAFGSPSALSSFVKRLGTEAPPAARVLELRERGIGVEPVPDFAIAESRGDGARRVSIPPELATCPDCLAEIFDPADRRYLYPFINCTNCGPRYTIVRDSPTTGPRPRWRRSPCAPPAGASTTTRSTGASTPSPTPARRAARACGCWAAAADDEGPFVRGGRRDAIPEAARALSPGGSSR